MQKQMFKKLGWVACVAVLTACTQVRGDMAEASGMLADIAAAAAEANAEMAAAANSGDTDAIEAAQAAVKAIADASEAALEAYAALEQSGGNNDSAMAALEKARNDARTALNGDEADVAARPEPVTEGDEYQLPNPKDVLWESDALREQYESLWNIVQGASAHGGADFPDRDADREATPI